ncbi:hypothetical protein JG688_00013035 [Phytophthora aleatoria]|uniref:Uncharacterized protein n=1 Tax=Phytophthora aleatoria TaxID=2496075 RepID=A0A8J5IMJ8_9STRA|nr:hypothetical protein JG688_00013035 [Phytophthora aleatoria]
MRRVLLHNVNYCTTRSSSQWARQLLGSSSQLASKRRWRRIFSQRLLRLER